MTKPMPSTAEVMHKLKCGQNIFRKPLIEKMVDEFIELANTKGIDLEATASVEIVAIKTYVRAPASKEDKAQAKDYAEKLIRKNGIGLLGTMFAKLVLENILLTKEINVHRAARGITAMEVIEP